MVGTEGSRSVVRAKAACKLYNAATELFVDVVLQPRTRTGMLSCHSVVCDGPHDMLPRRTDYQHGLWYSLTVCNQSPAHAGQQWCPSCLDPKHWPMFSRIVYGGKFAKTLHVDMHLQAYAARGLLQCRCMNVMQLWPSPCRLGACAQQAASSLCKPHGADILNIRRQACTHFSLPCGSQAHHSRCTRTLASQVGGKG